MNVPKLHMAIMVWLAVFPTIALWQLILGDLLSALAPMLRTLILVTLTVPVVVFVALPRLAKLRARLVKAPVSSK